MGEFHIPKIVKNCFADSFAIAGARMGDAADVFVEYVGDFPQRQTASQVLNFGGAWRFTRLQQIDFHAGFGFSPASPKSLSGTWLFAARGWAVLNLSQYQERLHFCVHPDAENGDWPRDPDWLRDLQ